MLTQDGEREHFSVPAVNSGDSRETAGPAGRSSKCPDA